MANGTMATPNNFADPGFLYWAPLGSTLPTNTVVGSVFTDTWPVAWIALGMTEAGSTVTINLNVDQLTSAESIDPIGYRTTSRDSNAQFNLLNWTGTNLARALNTAATVVSGSTTTQLNKVSPPNPGSEVRAMLGWENVDSNRRWIGYQFINSGSLAIALQKAPQQAVIPFTANFEKPVSTQPVDFWTAGSTLA